MKAHATDTWTLLEGDCIEALRKFKDGRFDSIVTDPPYELGFMGKAWDASGVAFQVELWREVLRVLKPGGHLLAFGGTRTYHRMTCAIEDAGFEIRDSLHWMYGTGFPKSLDVSKAIDAAAGAKRGPGERRTDGRYASPMRVSGRSAGIMGEVVERLAPEVTAPATDLAKQWQGWGTALKPAHEPIVLARKPLAGTVAANVAAHGTGALNIDACRIAGADANTTGRANSGAKGNGGVYGASVTYTSESSPLGRWPANVLLDEHAAAELDAQASGASRFFQVTSEFCRCGSELTGGANTSVGRKRANKDANSDTDGSGSKTSITSGSEASSTGSANAAAYSEPSQCSRCGKPERSKDTASLARASTSPNGENATETDTTPITGNTANVPFKYVSKPSRKERDQGCAHLPPKSGGEATDREDGSIGTENPRAGAGRTGGARNYHPTVKPIDLMRYLVRLVTPPGGVVLDPFTGSGTTGIATLAEGFKFVGVEREPEYFTIAEARLRGASST